VNSAISGTKLTSVLMGGMKNQITAESEDAFEQVKEK